MTRGPSQAATGWPDGQDEALPCGVELLAVLDQGLEPMRARKSMNRPLEKPSSIAGLVQGWAGHPCRARPTLLTSIGTPALDVDAPCLFTRWAVRNDCRASHRSLL
jgi:hypothetical protein